MKNSSYLIEKDLNIIYLKLIIHCTSENILSSSLPKISPFVTKTQNYPSEH